MVAREEVARRNRMTDLTETEQRVLAELDEFWEENVFTMLNTIVEPRGDRQEVPLFQKALHGLVERDYVVMGLEGVARRDQEELGKSPSLDLIAEPATRARSALVILRARNEGGEHVS